MTGQFFLAGLLSVLLALACGDARGQGGRQERQDPEYLAAFFGSPHYVSVSAAFRHAGKDYALNNIVGCIPYKERARDDISRKRSWDSLRPSRRWLSTTFEDGSSAFLFFHQTLCSYWPEQWLPPEHAAQVITRKELPADFLPPIHWADRDASPGVIEMYVSRAAYRSSPLQLTKLAIAAIAYPVPPEVARRARSEDETANPHPLDRTGDKAWHSERHTLRGIPPQVWTQYPKLAEILRAYEATGAAAALSDEDRATVIHDVRDAHRLMTSPGGEIEGGVPGSDGRSGVLGCQNGQRPRPARATYLPQRCTAPLDFELPLDCSRDGVCRALPERMGTWIAFRRPPRQPIAPIGDISFRGNRIAYLRHGLTAIIFDPKTRMLFTSYNLGR